MTKEFFFIFQDFAGDDIQTNISGRSFITSTGEGSALLPGMKIILNDLFLENYNMLHSKYFNERHILSLKYHCIHSIGFYKSCNWESGYVNVTIRNICWWNTLWDVRSVV